MKIQTTRELTPYFIMTWCSVNMNLLHTSPAHCTFPMMRSVRYQPILHTLYYTLHTEHAYFLSYRFLNNVVLTTVIKMIEMFEILDGRLGSVQLSE